MFKTCLFLISLCSFISDGHSNESVYLQDKFEGAHTGDYIVTAHENAYSMLILRSLESDILTLEEVSVPSSQVNLKKIDWRTWLSKKAPGHTAWTLYEIDLKQGLILECFSCSKNGWIYLDDHEQFFAKLLTLPFVSVPEAEKKKIGPPPDLDETDHRKTWNPPLIIEGKRVDHPAFEVLHTRWPHDSSHLSLCDIEVYYDTAHPYFPFPHWIEVKSPHYALKVRGIESGHDIKSPMQMDMPRRPPELIRPTEKTHFSWNIHLNAPLYHESVHLFAIDLNTESRTTITIPHHFERQSQKEYVILRIDTQDLKKILQTDHRYQWAILSDKTPSVYVKSDEIFTWKNESYEH
jgi:hypothetical protein